MVAIVLALAQEAPGQMARVGATGAELALPTNSVPVAPDVVAQAVLEAREDLVAREAGALAVVADQVVVAVAAPAAELLVLLVVAARRASLASRSGQSAKNLK